jgi:hypothetical protein
VFQNTIGHDAPRSSMSSSVPARSPRVLVMSGSSLNDVFLVGFCNG